MSAAGIPPVNAPTLGITSVVVSTANTRHTAACLARANVMLVYVMKRGGGRRRRVGAETTDGTRYRAGGGMKAK